MANKSLMNGHSSLVIRNFNMRLPKAWKHIDWILSPDCKDATAKKEVALFFINKAIPTRTESLSREISLSLNDQLAERLLSILEAKSGQIKYDDSSIVTTIVPIDDKEPK